MPENSATFGFRKPAEWEPHDACWTAWPSDEGLWKQEIGPARRALVALCEAVADVDPESERARGERVEILVPDDRAETEARRELEGAPARLHRIPFGDIWIRDTGPAFVTSGHELRAACFGFNGWGGKYLFEHDPEVGERIAATAEVPALRYPWVLEGGAVEVDGEGTAITTRQCLLNPNRGAGLDQAVVEARLREALGVERIIWLDRGLAGDHTDGHVDMVARFVAPGVVVCAEPHSSRDPSHAALAEAREALRGALDASGRRLEVVPLPSPGPVRDRDGNLMPASYANFYIGNSTIAVPTYASRQDAAALAVIAQLFPGRRAVGIDARAILTGGGAFHCITQQQPRHPEAEKP